MSERKETIADWAKVSKFITASQTAFSICWKIKCVFTAGFLQMQKLRDSHEPLGAAHMGLIYVKQAY